VWRIVACISFLAAPAGIHLAYSQQVPPGPGEAPSTQQVLKVPSGFLEQASQNKVAQCLEPMPLPGLNDYDGPMKKTVGLFARTLESKSVHESRYKPGVVLCFRRPKDKFLLFVDDSIDPVTLLSAGFDAGSDHASNRDPTFGQGATGYAKRFGVDLADHVSSKFFKDFAYPTLFSEDPRYYRLGNGRIRRRLLHAAEHLVVAHATNGTHMFNYSEWLGTGSAVVLNNLYHPGEDRGAGAMARNMGYRFAWDIGFDVLSEFWPEIARKFKLPFRGVQNSQNSGPLLQPNSSRD
jgi:hypothetical protein